jgi:hypothetical protein
MFIFVHYIITLYIRVVYCVTKIIANVNDECHTIMTSAVKSLLGRCSSNASSGVTRPCGGVRREALSTASPTDMQ